MRPALIRAGDRARMAQIGIARHITTFGEIVDAHSYGCRLLRQRRDDSDRWCYTLHSRFSMLKHAIRVAGRVYIIYSDRCPRMRCRDGPGGCPAFN